MCMCFDPGWYLKIIHADADANTDISIEVLRQTQLVMNAMLRALDHAVGAHMCM